MQTRCPYIDNNSGVLQDLLLVGGPTILCIISELSRISKISNLMKKIFNMMSIRKQQRGNLKLNADLGNACNQA